MCKLWRDRFVSDITFTTKADVGTIRQVNDQITLLCEKYSFIFINNVNIRKEHLWKDGNHLRNSGTIIIVKSFINILKYFLSLRTRPPNLI